MYFISFKYKQCLYPLIVTSCKAQHSCSPPPTQSILQIKIYLPISKDRVELVVSAEHAMDARRTLLKRL